MKPSADQPQSDPSPDRTEDVSLALLEVRMIEAHHRWWKVLARGEWKDDASARQMLNTQRLAYQDAVLQLCQCLQEEALVGHSELSPVEQTETNLEASLGILNDSSALTAQSSHLRQSLNERPEAHCRRNGPEERVSCAAHLTSDNDLLVTVVGEVDFENAHVFRYLLQAKLVESVSTGPVTVDLSLVASIDSDGLAVLLSIYQGLVHAGRKMTLLFHSASRARSMVHLARLSRLIPQGE